MRNRVVAILAGGPSMSQAVADSARGYYRIAINDAFRLAPDAEMLYAADPEWWQAHPEALRFAGRRVVARPNRVDGVEYISPEPVTLGGGNSALRAAHIAAAEGAAGIRLYGVDLRDDEVTHWHGAHEHGLRNPSPVVFARVRAAWERWALRPGIPPVVNCSSRSALECFPREAAC